MTVWILAVTALAAAGFSARWNWWRKKLDGIPVLMYHKIGIAPANSQLKKLWVSPDRFARQVDWLLKKGYTPIHFADLDRAVKGEAELPEKPVLITFDDGYKNNYRHAYPVLKERNAKGNIFLVHNTVGKSNLWHDPASEAWIEMLTWEQIGEMLASGVFDVGSHTMNHASLPLIDSNTAEWEIRESKKQLEEKLGREIPAFAYPYGAGAFDPQIRKFALDAGYRFDFSVKQGLLPWHWKPADGTIRRLFIRGDDTMLDFALAVTRGKSRF
ncbi:MAG: polysaccharide deacetylase family protein [Elusimicrobiaceae bacterium]|nr:polysaccharide deacetylase family protein [Elusimicrobiaceae bacterium]